MNDFAFDMGYAVSRAGNAAATAGQEAVLAYAAQLPNREDYEPLEQLAAEVKRVFLETFRERFTELMQETA